MVLYTDASTKTVAGVLMQVQVGIEKPCIFVTRSIGTSVEMRNYGARTLRLRLLRQASISLPVRKTIYCPRRS